MATLHDLDVEVGAFDRRSHTDTVVDLLLAARLFEGIQREEIVEILRAFDEESFNAGHRITLEGLRGCDFFIVVDGRARVSVDGWRVTTLHRGDFFGEVGVLVDGVRTATVSAETPLRCLVLPNGGLEPLLVAHPRLGVNLLRQVATRFRDLTTEVRPPRRRALRAS
jgi:CRP-like cAMP-binding protein